MTTGPIVSESDFDMKHIYKGLKKIVKKYDISFEINHIVNQDDDLADRVWNAAIEFLAEAGVYSKDTGRVIQYTEEEIRRLVKEAPSSCVFGEGSDAILEVARTPEDSRPPINQGGPVAVPVPNEYFEPITMSYLQEARCDMHSPVTNMTVMGREIRTKAPTEILAAWEEVLQFKKIAQMAGRPGIYYNGIGISVSDIGQLAAGHLMGRHDGSCIGVISELKADNSIFNKITQMIMLDGPIVPYMNPIFGGLGGGVETQTVLLCAEMIALSVVFMGTTVGSTPTHPMLFCSSTKDILLESSIAFQAIARNSHIMTRYTHTQVGGCGTKTLLYEIIASCAMIVRSGIARVQGPRPATGAIVGACSGLEARFQGELLDAFSKVDRVEADRIAQLAYDKYEDQLDKKPYGKPFWEVYDVEKVQPTEEWLNIYEEVRQEAIDWGLPIE
jgi:methylamine--corrinoid protein Co-methyltransferase